jgi:acyl-CoA synthetase (AMP-forming)/AMP-acid ligase II
LTERIYDSPYPPVAIPDVTLHELILNRARELGGKPALIDAATGAITTYGDVAARARGLAAGLQRGGFRPGEVAAVCTPNDVDLPAVFFGVASAGGALTTINPAFTEAEMAKQLRDSGAVLAYTSPDLAERVGSAGGGRLRQVLTFGAELRAAMLDDEPQPVPIEPAGSVVALLYSSGTTGTPKGVMLTHRNLVAMTMQMGPVEGTTANDVTMAVLPFFHIYGLEVILTLGLYRGATLVVMRRFEMEPFLEAIQRYRVTRLPLVPPLILRLARDPAVDSYDLSSVRTVTSGAAPLASEVVNALSRRLGGVLVKQGYGMTELSPGATMHDEDSGAPPPGSVGRLHPNTEARLVSVATMEDAGEGEAGEIWIRGPQVMKGYLGLPSETAAVITADGWLKTGDIGRFAADGQLHVVDRLKELIKYKGYQVAPAELEAILLEHPAVAEAAVVARPDVEAGEIPKAFIVLIAGRTATSDEIMRFVAERVANYKRVREIEFVDSIPKSPSGKILRRLLVERDRSRSAPA